jgi:hypothetical protein
MAKFAEIISIEQQRTDQAQWNVIHLFKEGGFYRAYEWSAWLIAAITYNDEARQQSKDRKPLSVTRKKIRDSEDTFAFVGFPLNSVDKFIPNRTSFQAASDSQLDITIELAWDGDYTYDSLNEAFRKWKEEQPIQEPKTRRDESDAPSTSSHLSTSGIIADILAWPLEQKTPLENTMFISTLKQKIATLL